jgi:putative MATE family efflux protein
MIKDMTRGSEAKLIFYFTIPMFIGNVFQQLYNMVDALVVGRYVGRSALAAVGTSFPVMFLLISFVMGLTMGVSVIISQLFGAQETEKLKRAISTTIIFLTISAVVLTFIGLFSGHWLLKLLGTPPEVLDMATDYLNIIFAGMIFTFAYNAFSGILRGLGDSKTPLYFLIISALLNVVLDINKPACQFTYVNCRIIQLDSYFIIYTHIFCKACYYSG